MEQFSLLVSVLKVQLISSSTVTFITWVRVKVNGLYPPPLYIPLHTTYTVCPRMSNLCPTNTDHNGQWSLAEWLSTMICVIQGSSSREYTHCSGRVLTLLYPHTMGSDSEWLEATRKNKITQAFLSSHS